VSTEGVAGKGIRERINPYKMFYGAMVPNWLLPHAGVSPGAKLCYGALTYAAGHRGEAVIRRATLAVKLGVTERQANRYVEELVELGVIDAEGEKRKPLAVTFYRLDWFDAQRDRCVPLEGVNGTDKATDMSHCDADTIYSFKKYKNTPADAGGGEAKKPKGEKKGNPDHQPFIDAFCKRWEDKYGGRYAFDGGKDAAHIANILKRLGGVPWQLVLDRYFTYPNNFASDAKHPISVLRASLHKYLVNTNLATPKSLVAKVTEGTSTRAEEAKAHKLAAQDFELKRKLVAGLADDELAKRKAQVLAEASEFIRPTLEGADPKTSPMLVGLIYSALVKEGVVS
jgi:hypothetical protein